MAMVRSVINLTTFLERILNKYIKIDKIQPTNTMLPYQKSYPINYSNSV
ncbi:hypothetical protein ACVW2L_002583 [Mucilaginibacter sp. HD30]